MKTVFLLFLVKLKISQITYFGSVFQFEHNHACVAWFCTLHHTHTHTNTRTLHLFVSVSQVPQNWYSQNHVLCIKYHETPYSCRSVLFIFILCFSNAVLNSTFWFFDILSQAYYECFTIKHHLWFKIEVKIMHNE